MIDLESFEACLGEIESGEPGRKRSGVASLGNFLDSRALEVARVLMKDGDPEIRFQAGRVLETLQEKGVKPRLAKREDIHAEIESLASTNQILDEVFFVYRANLDEIVYNSLVTGIPKISLFAALAIYYSYFENLRMGMDNPQFMGLLVLCSLHVFLVRPLIWEKVGRAILGGFSDRYSRSVAKFPFSFNGYFRMLKANLFESLILVIPAGFVAISSASAGALTISLLFWVFLCSFLCHFLPCQMIFGGSVSETVERTYTLYGKRKDIIKTSFPSFCVLVGAFYIIFFLNFSIGFEKIFYPVGTTATLMGFLLADILLDPFWISYRILVARLMVQE